jgi:hypothetical protein
VHLSSSRFLVGSCYLIFSFICMFCRSLFVLFLLFIVLSVLLRFTDSDYRLSIFKLFIYKLNLTRDAPACIDDISRCWRSYLSLSLYLPTNTYKLLAFQSFENERTWWRLFQKNVLCTKLNIYVLFYYGSDPLGPMTRILLSMVEIEKGKRT